MVSALFFSDPSSPLFAETKREQIIFPRAERGDASRFTFSVAEMEKGEEELREMF